MIQPCHGEIETWDANIGMWETLKKMKPKNGFYLWNISQDGSQTLLNEEAALGELAHFARSIPPFFPTSSMQEWQK